MSLISLMNRLMASFCQSRFSERPGGSSAGRSGPIAKPFSPDETHAGAVAVPSHSTKPTTRFLFIDGLRGIAAVMVVIFHFTVADTDAAHPFIKGLPTFFVDTLANGQLGVEIFFVISGFVIAYSQRGTIVTARYFLNFALRRSFRLDPPYWFTIFLEICLLIICGHVFHGEVHALPTKGQMLAHLVYMQHLLRYEDIVHVFWTLCLEVQFYVLYTLIRAIVQYAREGTARNMIEGTLMSVLAITSLGIFAGWIPEPPTGFFLHYWFMFFLGVTVWWAISNSRRTIYFAGMMVMLCIAMATHFKSEIVLVVLTAGAIFAAAKFNRMGSWLSSRPIQFIGMISYSLYLIHVPIGLRVIQLGVRFTGASIGARLMLIFVGMLVSVAAATAMYFAIEKPSMRLSSRLLKRDWKKRTEPGYLTTGQ